MESSFSILNIEVFLTIRLRKSGSICNISLFLTDCGSLGLKELEIEAAFLRVAQG